MLRIKYIHILMNNDYILNDVSGGQGLVAATGGSGLASSSFTSLLFN